MTTNRLTCFSIAKGDTEKYIPNYFDIPTESVTSVDLNDIYNVIKSDIKIRKYKKKLIMYTLREKMEREIEKGMPDILHYLSDTDTDIDVNKEFNSLLTVLRYQHSYVCKLVMNNLHKIKREIEKEIERENDIDSTSFDSTSFDSTSFDSTSFDSTFYERYYEYSYIVNLMWSYRYTYAMKMFRDRMEINDM
jgi:hypothetical protein